MSVRPAALTRLSPSVPSTLAGTPTWTVYPFAPVGVIPVTETPEVPASDPVRFRSLAGGVTTGSLKVIRKSTVVALVAPCGVSGVALVTDWRVGGVRSTLIGVPGNGRSDTTGVVPAPLVMSTSTDPLLPALTSDPNATVTVYWVWAPVVGVMLVMVADVRLLVTSEKSLAVTPLTGWSKVTT